MRSSLIASVLLRDEAHKFAARFWPWQPTKFFYKGLHNFKGSPITSGLCPHGFAIRYRLASLICPLRLPPEMPQVFMANTASLLPGTSIAALDRSVLEAHALDRQNNLSSELKAEE
jgi:hypothetical protein